ncbi:hypothetical protein BC628DRAFT_873541 [Trametes gibbosa]|nr:hypothetical protein BC628DRAFT_873541 [Trametes gibbosa]
MRQAIAWVIAGFASAMRPPGSHRYRLALAKIMVFHQRHANFNGKKSVICPDLGLAVSRAYGVDLRPLRSSVLQHGHYTPHETVYKNSPRRAHCQPPTPLEERFLPPAGRGPIDHSWHPPESACKPRSTLSQVKSSGWPSLHSVVSLRRYDRWIWVAHLLAPVRFGQPPFLSATPDHSSFSAAGSVYKLI